MGAGFDFQMVFASQPAALKEPGIFQNAKMFRDGGLRHGERLGQISHAHLLHGKRFQHPAAGRIGQGGERQVEWIQFIVNHVVNYLSEDPASGKK